MEDCQIKNQAYFLNIDFDYELFSRGNFLPATSVANKEWDYILLWLLSEKDHVILHSHYDKLYLDSIEKIRGFRPAHVTLSNYHKDQVVPYWGNWDQYELKRVFADKVSLNKLLSPHPFVPSYQIFHNHLDMTLPHELPTAFAQWAVRPAQSFGGKGIQIFPIEQWNKIREILLSQRQDWVLMPWLNRSLDIGTSFENGKAVMSYFNLVDKRGSYRGSYYSSLNKNKLKDLTHFLQKVAPTQLKLISGNFASDSFFFKDEKDETNLGFYPFIEFNMRRTMGSLLYLAPPSIARKSWFGWFMIPAKGIHSFPEKIDGNGWLLYTTSPAGKRFWTFYLALDDENDLNSMQDFSTFLDKHLVLLRDHLSSLFAPEHNLHHFQKLKW